MKAVPTEWALIFAMVAAVGNVLVAYGQKKAMPNDNPFLIGVGAFFIGSIILAACALYFPTKDAGLVIRQNVWWMFLSGLGYAILTMGMYFLYRNFGATYYTLYAVLAIASTSIGLAVLVFGERLSMYHLLSLGCALLTVIFFLKAQIQK